MTATEAFARSVGQTIQYWSDEGRVAEFASQAGIDADVNPIALVRLARRIAMGVAHTILVTIDNGGSLADEHLLALVETDREGNIRPGAELAPGLHERAFDYLPDDFIFSE